ncbi:excalibur calcium-binding domain-containing protein [Bacillus mojavensis]|uniref:excalibur calcium-binding domain-containing protein n=1 Tax=Bacillus mojavensis TaxID=72360 RepID=UPI002DB9728F|nr:excalibur calcium-binding domain-containing protein [Bacillus mojavensis]MEC1679501.1 excalibur calcium-binding domain-containing protein [Bacillus mojavensis]MEC1712360.1 excalibur calcium-binding domain-containing protein [Bacillus mojavensis]
MQKWVGKRPTMGQKNLVAKYKRLLQQEESVTLTSLEKVLKIIEVECDKKSSRELKGVLGLTTQAIFFVSKHERMRYEYSQISDIDVRNDEKEKNNLRLSLKIGRSKRRFDDIKKNDDSQEFIEILEYMISNQSKEILTTVTHDFDYFLHAEKLAVLQNQNVHITSFLLERDNLSFTKNGERLLREKHKNAALVAEGFFQEDKQKKGNFIVLESQVVYLYEFDNKERKARLLYKWDFIYFSGAMVDRFAIKTVVNVPETGNRLVIYLFGKEFVSILNDANILLKQKKRKWYQKILGFRSGIWWKRSIASLVYLLLLLLIFSTIFGEETKESNSAESSDKTSVSNTEQKVEQKEKESNHEDNGQQNNKSKQEEKAEKQAEEKRKQEEEAKQAEKERLAEEKRKQEEEVRLAEEKRKQEEEAKQAEKERLAEEKRKQEEKVRLAEEKRKQEEEAQQAEAQEQQTNVYYKNCTAARQAGAAPIHIGEPGYGKHLDRDGDGIGCDR